MIACFTQLISRSSHGAHRGGYDYRSTRQAEDKVSGVPGKTPQSREASKDGQADSVESSGAAVGSSDFVTEKNWLETRGKRGLAGGGTVGRAAFG